MYIGARSDGFVHFYESETNQGIRYKRYRLDWSMLELGEGDKRFFHINGTELIEMQKVGSKWLTLTATDKEKQRALNDQRTRMKGAMLKMPVINVKPKTLGEELVPVLPKAAPEAMLEYFYDNFKDKSKIPFSRDSRPNVSVDDCPLVEHITGKIGPVTEEYIKKTKDMYKGEEKIRVGDTVYEWDMGGWESLAGRAGEVVFRGDEYIASALTKMS